ncbi:MAG: ABC transporter ATP-binding protein [Gemmataceae bacterium]
MLDVVNLTKAYGTRDVLRGVSFSVRPGEAVAYLGPNGAGKSTTVKIIAGLLRPAGGSVTVCGHDVTTAPLEAKKRLGYVPDSAQLYETLTPAEYLSLCAELHHLDRPVAAERMRLMLQSFDLAAAADRPIETLSRGQRQKVLIIAALLHDPDVLLLDEPLNGLDVNSGLTLRQVFARLLERGKAILFCTHIFEIVERVCQRVVVIDQGKVVADEPTATLLKRSPGGTLEAVFRQLTRPDEADDGAKAFLAALERDKGLKG